jgi:hypothetical protein
MVRTVVLLGLLLCGWLSAQVTNPSIPDPVALVQEVEAHQRQLDQLRENFTFNETRETEVLDGKGAVTNRSSEEHQIFFVNRHRIARLVKKDGKELSPRDQAAEQERVRHAVEKATKSPLEHNSYREGGDLEMSRILAVMNISNPRRVSVNGRDTLAFDFTGDRHASAHGIALSAARKMSGTVWVDEGDRQVARLEASFDDNFRIGGGLLATVQKGTFVRMEQTHVGQGLWLPSVSDVHLTARELMVKGLRQNMHFRDFDFRRFEVGVAQKLGEAHQ